MLMFDLATSIQIAPHLAHDCLQSIPNRPGPAIDLLNSFEPLLEFQSDKDAWLLDPPEGYLFPGVDLDKYMATIRENVQTGNYESEYDFQVDIQTMLLDAKDAHLWWNGDLNDIFTFSRPISLVSVSADGQGLPQIYVSNDLITIDSADLAITPNRAYTPSPVKTINDIDALTFLLSQCLAGHNQDPDALYNSLFYQLSKQVVDIPGLFQYPQFYPGETTNITFTNGTTHTYPTIAHVNVNFAGIQTGDDAYDTFCSLANKMPVEGGGKARRQASTTATSFKLPYYPPPVISSSTGVVSGYFLDAPFDHVAVLAIYSFDPLNEGGELEFQSTIHAFLSAAVTSDKHKLIIDLQGNTGGYIDLALDTFAQLFPSIPPDVKSNMKTSLGMQLLAQTAADIYDNDLHNPDLNETEIDLADITPFAYQSVMTPDAKNFASFDSFYGPVDGVTQYFQNNYSDPHQSDILGTGINVTGTNNRMHYLQPFSSNQVIMLYDGTCASACAVFSEHMKNFARVQSISIGGRPQTGPSQAVGGTKGAQVFPLSSFQTWIELFRNGTDYYGSEGTIFENLTDLVYQRSSTRSPPGAVNGRNNFRIGDDTATPLQFVYEASDCRIWWTREMLYDPTFLWARTAQIAFHNRTGTQFDSVYCVTDSSGHPTSLSGALKRGEIGDQTPPANAKLQDRGWIVDGDTISLGGPAEEKDPVVVLSEGGNQTTDGSSSSSVASDQPQVHKSQQITDACNNWVGAGGSDWLTKMICKALSY